MHDRGSSKGSLQIEALGWLFVIALSLAPVIYGANIPIAWAVNAIVFGGLLALFAILHALSNHALPVPLHRYSAIAGLFAVVLAWIFLQTQTWMPGALHAWVWDEATRNLGAEVPGAISVNPGATMRGLLRLSTAAAVFLLALQLGRDPRWATRIIFSIAIAGALYSLCAMGLKAEGPEVTAQFLPRAISNSEPDSGLTIPFINRNHLAAYLSIAIVCAWTSLIGDLRRQTPLPLGGHRQEVIAAAIGPLAAVGRHAILLMPLAAALLMTTSRAAFFLTAAAVLLVALCDRAPAGSLSYAGPVQSTFTASPALRLMQTLPVLLAALGLLLVVAAHGDTLVKRFASGDANADIWPRLAVAEIALRAIADQPILGYGYGTFVDVFPLFRTENLSAVDKWSEAHNSYLEAILGLGLPMALALFAGFAMILHRCWQGARTRRRDRLAPVAALAATFVVSLHALVDFSIQIEGIALTYAAVLGAGYAQSWSHRTAWDRTVTHFQRL
jgi:O-antigen ligase